MSGSAKILLGIGGVVLVGLSLLIGSIFFNAPEVQFVESNKTSATLSPKPISHTAPRVKTESVQQNHPQPNNTPQPNSSPSPAPIAATYTPPPAQPKCTGQVRAMLDENYQIYLAAEDSRYQSALDNALGALRDRGLGAWGQADLVRQQQAQIHEQKLEQIDNEYLAQLIKYECV